MLNRQIQVKISLLGLKGAANVKQALPNAPAQINFVVHSLGDFVFGMLLCSENATRQLLEIEGVPDFVLIGENLKFLWKLRWLFFFLNSNLSLKYIPTKKLIKKIEDSHEEARTAWSSGAT